MEDQEKLPKPEVSASQEQSQGVDSENESIAAQKIEKKPAAVTGAGAMSMMAVDDAQSGVQGAVTDAGATATGQVASFDIPDIAEDIDLIEKEWVEKAKEIVAATQGDPHAQNNQINRIKVEYIKKRYNKDIKFKEE